MEYPLPQTHIALFRGKEIRKTIHNNEWWFVIVDIVATLTDSVQPDGYIKDMRRRDPELFKGWGQIATPLSIQTAGGPQLLNCANAIAGGEIAGGARRKLEKRIRRSIVSRKNYIKEPEDRRLLKKR